MAAATVVPTDRELKVMDFSSSDTQHLIREAEANDAADRASTVMGALKKYKKAEFWAMFLSTSLIMEGYGVVIVRLYYEDGPLRLSKDYDVLHGMVFAAIFIVFYAPSLSVLSFGESMCGIPWGVFQTLSTNYASEVVPTVLRPYVTAYICMCWGAGILLSSGVVRAMVGVSGDLGQRLPFALQWVWPLPLLVVGYLAPESPWNAIRRGNIEDATKSLGRLRQDTSDMDLQVARAVAYIKYTTELERAETANASYLECFRGVNLRQTEINCVVWVAQILCGNAILGYSVLFLKQAGFSEVQAFNVNISLSACYIIGGIICWFLFPHFGRATIYMSGMTVMFFILVVIGGLGCTVVNKQLAIGILLVFSTLCKMITIGPVCYPIVAETPSGQLRYKIVSIGRFVYNLTGLFHNSVTPRMLSPIEFVLVRDYPAEAKEQAVVQVETVRA
ncbi:hypothetical protein EKO04_007691 [Ascochyta lentis]|uniref:Sugar transporter n=1 Tax=Ascochyta lentis TaxID=205686 RepID=A0A8H7J1A1_9PLEO|nr:hypothetical protein EKO04_007691 [Ascochyta lentis]